MNQQPDSIDSGIADLSTSLGCVSLRSTVSAVTASVDDDHVSIVSKTVQPCGSQERRIEEIRPFREIAVAGQQNTATLIAPADHIVEVLRGRRVQRLEPEVIQHQ